MHTKSLILGGDSHLLVAKTRENMANIYARTGKFNQALNIKSTNLFWKPRSAYAAKTPRS
jgi:hypothetical protein